jgi:aminopeptidase N
MIRRLPLALLLLLPCTAAFAQEELRTPPTRPVDVLHIDLDLVVDLKAKSVAGMALITIKALRAVQSVRFDAVDHQIHGIERRDPGLSRTLKVPYSYDGESLTAEIALERGQVVTLGIRYAVVDPKSGLSFFGPTDDAPGVPWQVWSQGEAIQNRYWFPCVDHPDERQSTSLTAHVDPELDVISNGVLVRREKSLRDPRLMAWHFEQKREHVAYLVSLIVGKFESAQDSYQGKIPLTYYVPPGRKADIPRSFSRTKDMLALFERLTGEAYPWPKYDQTVVFEFSAGGMENTGATTLNERTLHDERAHLDTSSEGLVAHELAHQWYGDLLTCRDWSHLWLNESFATFFALCWFEHADGQDEYEHRILRASEGGMRAGKKRAILDRRYSHPWSMFDGRAYPKGGSVLHMLRRQLGEETFWRGIQRYTKENRDQSVETGDLRRALERASGQNLERFFYDWVSRPGNPKLDVSLERDAERGLLTVRVKQTQKGEAYHFPAEVEFWFGDERVTRTFQVTEKDDRFVLPERRAPTRFRFDPREAVILKEIQVNKGEDLWLAQLKEDASVIGRIRAARVLAKRRSPQVKEAVVNALTSDPFWGVRAEIAKLLAAGDDAARDALIARLAADAHPKVRRACADALGQRRHDAVVAQALLARLTEGDASYAVQAALVEGYAKAFDGLETLAARKVLAAQLKVSSHNEVIRQAAIRGFRVLESPAAIATLAELTLPQHHKYVRDAAARALSLAGLPSATSKQVRIAVAALRACLDRSRSRVKRAALEGLKAIGNKARAALPAIEALAQRHPEERVRTQAKQTAEAIRAGAPPVKELSRLRALTAKLTERTAKLEEERDALEARVKRLEEAVEGLGEK